MFEFLKRQITKMKRIIKSSQKHWEIISSEVLIVFGAVILGEYFLDNFGINLLTLLIAFPALLMGLIIRSYVNKKYNSRI